MNSKLKFRAAGTLCLLVLAAELLWPSPLTDSALQLGFAASCVWALRSSGVLGSMGGFTDLGSPSLRSLARIAPVLVLVQMWMGTALRYGAMGPLSHVLVAMMVGAYLLYFATGVTATAPSGHAAYVTAIWLLCVVGVQVLLGIAAYLVRYSQGGTDLLPETQAFSRMHIVSGTILLGLTVVMAELVPNSSRKPEAQSIV